MSTNKDDNEYEVGFGKPPKSTRFKKGQSGNPAGKKKGTKNLKTDLEEELKGMIEIIEGGTKRKITRQRGLVKATVNKGLKGDIRATGEIVKILAANTGLDAKIGDMKGVSMGDKQILSLFLEQNGYERSIEAEPAIPDQVEIDPAVQWMFDE